MRQSGVRLAPDEAEERGMSLWISVGVTSDR
jgi:hypothetical protein